MTDKWGLRLFWLCAVIGVIDFAMWGADHIKRNNDEQLRESYRQSYAHLASRVKLAIDIDIRQQKRLGTDPKVIAELEEANK